MPTVSSASKRVLKCSWRPDNSASLCPLFDRSASKASLRASTSPLDDRRADVDERGFFGFTQVALDPEGHAGERAVRLDLEQSDLANLTVPRAAGVRFTRQGAQVEFTGPRPDVARREGKTNTTPT